MCLGIYAEINAPVVLDLDELRFVSGLSIEGKGKKRLRYLNFSMEGGCSCSMISDDADWNDPEWDLLPEAREGLSKAIEHLHAKAGRLSLQALWAGDKIESRSDVSLESLLLDIRQNKL